MLIEKNLENFQTDFEKIKIEKEEEYNGMQEEKEE